MEDQCFHHLINNNFQQISFKLGDRIDTLWNFGRKKTTKRILSGMIVDLLPEREIFYGVPMNVYIMRCDKIDIKGFRSGHHKLRLVFLDHKRVFSIKDQAIVSYWKENEYTTEDESSINNENNTEDTCDGDDDDDDEDNRL